MENMWQETIEINSQAENAEQRANEIIKEMTQEIAKKEEEQTTLKFQLEKTLKENEFQ